MREIDFLALQIGKSDISYLTPVISHKGHVLLFNIGFIGCHVTSVLIK